MTAHSSLDSERINSKVHNIKSAHKYLYETGTVQVLRRNALLMEKQVLFFLALTQQKAMKKRWNFTKN
jgi:hypothetical protein